MATETKLNKGIKTMETKSKLMILASPVIFLPMIVIAMGLGMPSGLVLFGLVTYIAVLIKALSI